MSQIRSCIEYLLPTYNILMLRFNSQIRLKNLAVLAVLIQFVDYSAGAYFGAPCIPAPWWIDQMSVDALPLQVERTDCRRRGDRCLEVKDWPFIILRTLKGCVRRRRSAICSARCRRIVHVSWANAPFFTFGVPAVTPSQLVHPLSRVRRTLHRPIVIPCTSNTEVRSSRRKLCINVSLGVC